MAPGRIIKAEADDFEALSGAGKACCSGLSTHRDDQS